MVQEMFKRNKMKKPKGRPPAYPQVEFLDDLDNVICRHCGLPIGDIIELEMSDISRIKSGLYANWMCLCQNVFKIVRRNGKNYNR